MPRRQWGTLNWHKVGGDRIESAWTKRQQRVEFLFAAKTHVRVAAGQAKVVMKPMRRTGGGAFR